MGRASKKHPVHCWKICPPVRSVISARWEIWVAAQPNWDMFEIFEKFGLLPSQTEICLRYLIFKITEWYLRGLKYLIVKVFELLPSQTERYLRLLKDVWSDHIYQKKPGKERQRKGSRADGVLSWFQSWGLSWIWKLLFWLIDNSMKGVYLQGKQGRNMKGKEMATQIEPSKCQLFRRPYLMMWYDMICNAL